MRVQLLSVLTSALVATVAPLYGQRPADTADTADIRTVGNATQAVVPDRAVLTVAFSAEGSSPTAANRQLAARVDSIRAALAPYGVRRDSITTTSSSAWWGGRLEPFYAQRTLVNRDPRPRTGSYSEAITVTDTLYRAREICDIRVGDITKVGPIIDALVALHVNDVQNVAFSRTDTHAIREAALKAATLDARAQAEIIAAASGGRLGRALSLSTVSDAQPTSRFGLDEAVLTGQGVVSIRSAEATKVAPPPVVVTATVYGRWLLLPKP